MILSPVALEAAKEHKSRIYRLILLSSLIAVLEASTLLLVFAFVSTLTGASPSSNVALQLLGLLHGFDVKLQAMLLFMLATIRFSLGLLLEWKMVQLWVEMRAEMQTKMLSMHLHTMHSYLQTQKHGEHLHNIMTGPSMGAIYYLHFVRFSSTLLMISVLLATLFLVSPWLAGLGLIVAVIYGGVVKRISTKISYVEGRRQAENVKNQTEMVAEGLSGIRYIKAMGYYGIWNKEFYEYAQTAKQAFHKASFANAVPSRVLEYLIIALFLGIAMLVYLRGYNVEESIPTIAVYFLGIVRILPTLSVLGNGRMQMLNVLPHLQKYVALCDTLPQERDVAGKLLPDDLLMQDICFEGVGFGYAQQKVLHNLSLTIKARSFTAIIGSSGQGKSTLLDLLMRIIDPEDGSIKVGEIDISEVSLSGWREQLGYVGQDPFLFHDTISNNIKAGNVATTEEQIIEAARTACIHDFIAKMPDGYDTVLSDRGHSLSGGQRQRLAIARALASNAKILIMDEPTSALDSRTELNVIKGIQQAWKGGIVLVTHRKELLHHADNVLVISEGRVAEQGTLQELDDKGVLFKQIFRPHVDAD